MQGRSYLRKSFPYSLAILQDHNLGTKFYSLLTASNTQEEKVSTFLHFFLSISSEELIELMMYVISLTSGYSELEIPILQALLALPPQVDSKYKSYLQNIILTLGKRHRRSFRRFLWKEIQSLEKQRRYEALILLSLGPGLRQRDVRTLSSSILGKGEDINIPLRIEGIKTLTYIISESLITEEENVRAVRVLARNFFSYLKKVVSKSKLFNGEKLLLGELTSFLGYLSSKDVLKKEFVDKVATFLLDHLWDFARVPGFLSGLSELLCGNIISNRVKERGALLLINFVGRRWDWSLSRLEGNDEDGIISENQWITHVILGLSRMLNKLPIRHDLRPLILGSILSKWEKVSTLAELWNPLDVYTLLNTLTDIGISNNTMLSEKKRIFEALCIPLKSGAIFPALAESIGRMINYEISGKETTEIGEIMAKKILKEISADFSEQAPEGFLKALTWLVKKNILSATLSSEVILVLSKYEKPGPNNL